MAAVPSELNLDEAALFLDVDGTLLAASLPYG